MSRTSLTADRIKLEALHGLTGRAPARAAGLSVFNGHHCPVRGHGRVRTMAGSHCLDCVEAVDNIKKKAQAEGREAAIRVARAELARDLKAVELARLKAQDEVTKAREKADRLKEAKAAERAKRKAERQASLAPQAAPVEPVAALLCVPEDDDDDRLPWE